MLWRRRSTAARSAVKSTNSRLWTWGRPRSLPGGSDVGTQAAAMSTGGLPLRRQQPVEVEPGGRGVPGALAHGRAPAPGREEVVPLRGDPGGGVRAARLGVGQSDLLGAGQDDLRGASVDRLSGAVGPAVEVDVLVGQTAGSSPVRNGRRTSCRGTAWRRRPREGGQDLPLPLGGHEVLRVVGPPPGPCMWLKAKTPISYQCPSGSLKRSWTCSKAVGSYASSTPSDFHRSKSKDVCRCVTSGTSRPSARCRSMRTSW